MLCRTLIRLHYEKVLSTFADFARVAQREEALATGEMLVQIQPRALKGHPSDS
jgi:hypothetical protein